MPEVELPVQVQEDGVVVDVGRHVFRLGPGRGLEELVRQLGEGGLVQVVHLVHVTFLDNRNN